MENRLINCGMILSMVLLVSNSLFGKNNSSEEWLIHAEN